jgi:histidine triad (HIT) family protein
MARYWFVMGAVERPCVFCQIVAGEVGARVVHADDAVIVFLDARPVFKGHVLVAPRRHVMTLPDLDPVDVGPFFERVRDVAATMPRALDADGTFVAMNNVVSQSVAHLHCHVVPRRFKDGLRGFFWPRQRYDDDAEMDRYAATLEAALAPRS